MKSLSRTIRIGLILAVVASPFALGGGCDSDLDQFRQAARPALEAGTRYFLDGLVSGAFAVFDANHGQTGTTGATGQASTVLTSGSNGGTGATGAS